MKEKEPFNPPKLVKTHKPHGMDPESHPAVDTAILHTAEMFAGGRTESTLNAVKVPGLFMYWIRPEGLFYKCKGQEGLIPAGNVRRVVFKNNE